MSLQIIVQKKGGDDVAPIIVDIIRDVIVQVIVGVVVHAIGF